ncbi:MAG: iron-containing alcohol dehydrogenase [Chloroflexi bacterium]|nr:iron-containing alcohol dehydrogenase [Chloroflexota bacterium]
MRFDFSTTHRIVFGPGTVKEAGAAAQALGCRPFVVTGRTPARAEPLLAALRSHGLSYVTFAIAEEPTTDIVRQGTRLALAEGCDLVIAFGGGSVMDGGKAIAALATNRGDPLDYMEGIGGGNPLTRPALPIIAIPTTAGTGAEVTRNAVIASPEHKVKASLRSPFLLPRLALVDPELTHSLPPEITAGAGLDALTQLIEPFVTPRANPLTDAFCREGLARAVTSLRRAYTHGDDAAAREEMALASLFGGLALANAGLGAVHGFAAALCGMFPAPHGPTCAALLPHVMAINVRALIARQPDGPALGRYHKIGGIVTGDSIAKAKDGVEWVAALCRDLTAPRLSAYGVTRADFAVLVEKAAVASSMKANPIALTRAEMEEALEKAL